MITNVNNSNKKFPFKTLTYFSFISIFLILFSSSAFSRGNVSGVWFVKVDVNESLFFNNWLTLDQRGKQVCGSFYGNNSINKNESSEYVVGEITSKGDLIAWIGDSTETSDGKLPKFSKKNFRQVRLSIKNGQLLERYIEKNRSFMIKYNKEPQLNDFNKEIWKSCKNILNTKN
jgi:hypothetical protein